MPDIFRRIILPVMLFLSLTVTAHDWKDSPYIPEFHGVFIGSFTDEFSTDIKRFQVQHARVSLQGSIAPSISYFVQFDACARGKMTFLDAYGKIGITRGLSFQAGQFREPFGVEPFSVPANYIFSNRAFLVKKTCNYRGVGAKLSYTFPRTPLTLEAGGFNTTSISDHTKKNTQLAFASKVLWKPGNWILATGYMSQAPEGKRFSLYDLAAGWKSSKWNILAEGMAKPYTHSGLATTYSYLVQAQRSFPVKWGVFNIFSVQGRFDGMTQNSSGTVGENGDFAVTNPERNRITVGATLTYTFKKMRADVRVDYENYFYHSGAVIAEGLDDKIVAELIISF